MSKTKMTVGQAIVKFLNQQYIEMDGKEEPFVDGIFTIFGHGMVVGLGQALEEDPGHLRVYQGRNEQGMAHAAISYAKQHNRRKIIACSSSIGVGAANMVTAALTATINNIPLLLFPSDSFATRQPDPVLQQLEVPSDLSVTASDCFKPVAKYWDRVTRPEQLMSAMINAMRVLTDTANCGTAVISMPQDVQGESFAFPDYFFQKRVHHVARRVADDYEIDKAVELTKDVYMDLNNDGAKDTGDQLGFVMGSYNQLYGFIDSFNLQILERDEEGYPSKFVFSSEKCINAVQKLVSLFKDNNAFGTLNVDGNDYMVVFSEGRALFCTGEFKDTSSYRDIDEFDYGVIPMPKWDTAQEDYRTTARATYSSFCIPVTAIDPNMSAAVLECFASESYRKVSPAYFENALKIKYARDDESAQMYDLIKSSITFSFATSFTMAIGDPQNLFKDGVAYFNDNWASKMATWEPQSQALLEETLETLKELP